MKRLLLQFLEKEESFCSGIDHIKHNTAIQAPSAGTISLGLIFTMDQAAHCHFYVHLAILA
jgi:hypothetical protein